MGRTLFGDRSDPTRRLPTEGQQQQRSHQHLEHRTVTSFLSLKIRSYRFVSFNVCSYKHPSPNTLSPGRSGAPRGCDTTSLFYYHIVNTFYLNERVDRDEDMTPMHMTMFGAWYGGIGGQQRCPSQEGGPRLIRFESLRCRPKATKVRARLGVLEQHVLKMMTRSHIVSVLGVLYMDGKIISWIFQWHWSHLKIQSESMGIVKTIRHPT